MSEIGIESKTEKESFTSRIKERLQRARARSELFKLARKMSGWSKVQEKENARLTGLSATFNQSYFVENGAEEEFINRLNSFNATEWPKIEGTGQVSSISLHAAYSSSRVNPEMIITIDLEDQSRNIFTRQVTLQRWADRTKAYLVDQNMAVSGLIEGIPSTKLLANLTELLKNSSLTAKER